MESSSPAYAAPPLLCSPVTRSELTVKISFMIDAALFPALPRHPATTLRVAASDYLGKGLLAPVLRDLLDAEPPVRFEIVTTHSREGVRLVASGDVDLAVVTGQETPRGLEDRHLFDQPF